MEGRSRASTWQWFRAFYVWNVTTIRLKVVRKNSLSVGRLFEAFAVVYFLLS